MKCEKNANRVSNGSFYFDQPYNKTNSDWRHRSMVSFIALSCGNIAYCAVCLRHLGNKQYSVNLAI